ncbi:putative cytokinetic ring protein SteA [Desulfothermobacter acidiphilus]|uniref:putative cytokinetic ring protein SteA n=1 Tax=Desulfothermobacter acidiphilus TaxID=1938353 RepID=UPI003F8C221D
MQVRAKVKVDRRTKRLIQRLEPGDIAVIDHYGIDKLAAQGLIDARCRLVLNAAVSLSEEYPNEGPLMLLKAGIPVIDNLGPGILSLPEGDEIEVRGGEVYHCNRLVARGRMLDLEQVEEGMRQAQLRLSEVLLRFVDNTLSYAKKEVELITRSPSFPELSTRIERRQVLIVVRGYNYKEDLRAIRTYIREVRPVLIGVDGGADALLEFGYTPDIVVGDMDSVSDAALHRARDLVVHAYPSGEAPGLARVKSLGLRPVLVPMPGTSEDLAMLLAYEKGASLIVALGTHSNVLDFLEKGRKGMGSTFLVRLKVGSILVDAKGVSQLYQGRFKGRYLVQLLAAALLPLTAVVLISPPLRQLVRLAWLQMRLLFGF